MALIKNQPPAPHSDSDGLRGLDDIAAYAQYGRKAIPKLVSDYGFPAEEFFGAWESSKSLIDNWRVKRILAGGCQSVSAG